MTLGMVWFLARTRVGAKELLAAAVCAIVASYSSAFGLSALPAGLLILAMRRDVARSLTIAWGAFCVATAGVYFLGLRTLSSTGHESPKHVMHLILYVLAYLGTPLGRSLGIMASTILGIIVLAAFIGSTCIVVRAPHDDGNAFGRSIPWFGLALFALATGAMIAFGRAQFGPKRLLIMSRYETEAIVFWIATLPLCAAALERGGVSWKSAPVRVGALLILGIGAALYLRNAALGVGEMHAAREQRRIAYATIVSGSASPNAALASVIEPYARGATGKIPLILYDLSALRSVGDGPQVGQIFRAAHQSNPMDSHGRGCFVTQAPPPG